MIDWKFKENAELQGSADGFWYDITDGGYIEPDLLLDNKWQIAKVKEAVEILKDFEQAMDDNDLLVEY